MGEILIPFNGTWLALSKESFREALARGREVAGQTTTHRTAETTQERVLDADGMEAVTGVPASWFLEAARQGKIPHLRVGKYVRFRLNEVLKTLRDTRHTDRLSASTKKRTTDQSVADGCYHVATKTVTA